MKIAISVVVKSILFFVFFVVSVGLLFPPDSLPPVFWRFFAELIPMLIIMVVTLLFWFIDKRRFKLHLVDRPLYGTGVGIVSGILWLGGTIAILMILGALRFENSNHVELIGVWILAVFFNVVMQELLVRGYLYQMIKFRYNKLVATIVTTVLFTALHGQAFETGIVSVLNVLTMSLFMSVLLEYTNSLVAPIVIHFLWNALGAVILGSVSLAPDYPNLLNPVFTGHTILVGSNGKIEDSIVVLVLNLVLMVYFLSRKK